MVTNQTAIFKLYYFVTRIHGAHCQIFYIDYWTEWSETNAPSEQCTNHLIHHKHMLYSMNHIAIFCVCILSFIMITVVICLPPLPLKIFWTFDKIKHKTEIDEHSIHSQYFVYVRSTDSKQTMNVFMFWKNRPFWRMHSANDIRCDRTQHTHMRRSFQCRWNVEPVAYHLIRTKNHYNPVKWHKNNSSGNISFYCIYFYFWNIFVIRAVLLNLNYLRCIHFYLSFVFLFYEIIRYNLFLSFCKNWTGKIWAK